MLEERGVPPRGHESSAPPGARRPLLINTLGGASAVLATLPVLDQSTSINRSRACLDATRRLATWLASWGDRWGGNPFHAYISQSIHMCVGTSSDRWERPSHLDDGVVRVVRQ